MNTVLALMAHPDDAEILCGGTLVFLAQAGWKVHIASAAPGDCGSATLPAEEIAAIRRSEGAAAAQVIGGTYHCLESRDLCVRYEPDLIRAACGLLREVRPRIVIAHSPVDYMIDHEQASLVARAAAFNAPIPNAPAPPGSTPLESIPWLYYASPVEGIDCLGEPVRSTILVDTERSLETKLEMLACHASQRDWLRSHHGIDEYLERVRRWSAETGQAAGLAHAEGFRQHLGHAYPRDDLLTTELTAAGVSCVRT